MRMLKEQTRWPSLTEMFLAASFGTSALVTLGGRTCGVGQCRVVVRQVTATAIEGADLAHVRGLLAYGSGPSDDTRVGYSMDGQEHCMVTAGSSASPLGARQ